MTIPLAVRRIAAALAVLLVAPGGTLLASGPDEDCHRAARSHLESEPAGEAPAAEPLRLASLDVAYTDHQGRAGVLADLVDRPVLLTFFYTRCQNSKKCPMTVARLASLQKRLEETGMARRVRLVAITYEPQLDTPERLRRYASARGFELGPDALAIRLDDERQQEVVDELLIEVSYNAGWVNGHAVELSLLAAGGDVVRRYHATDWDNEQVEEDLRGLLR